MCQFPNGGHGKIRKAGSDRFRLPPPRVAGLVQFQQSGVDSDDLYPSIQ